MSVTAVEAPTAARDLRFWAVLRQALAVVAFLVLLLTGLLHRTDASVEDLRSDVERGSTREVTVAGSCAVTSRPACSPCSPTCA